MCPGLVSTATGQDAKVDFLYIRDFKTWPRPVLSYQNKDIPDTSFTFRETGAKFFSECAIRLAGISALVRQHFFLRKFTDTWRRWIACFPGGNSTPRTSRRDIPRCLYWLNLLSGSFNSYFKVLLKPKYFYSLCHLISKIWGGLLR